MSIIDLERLTGEGKVHNLSGRLRGEAARQLFEIDRLDDAAEAVRVVVPDYVYSITPSFFQGLFGRSVRALGNNANRFHDHYRFIAPAIVMEQLEHGLAAVLTNRNLNNIH